ncbi:MAG: beta-N-acetylglucosaminidase domain-containing protein, partial [Selenomonas sp.]|nr:beta-N-acetylglucosaminidase domain-containing protein [Selenomonas sp.]
MTGLLLAGLMASPAAAFAEAIPLRGIVEGFYGTPWTTTDRMD